MRPVVGVAYQGAGGASSGPERGTPLPIETETADDACEVEALFDLCFAPGREALSSYRLRDGVLPVGALCLVLRDEPDPAMTAGGWPAARWTDGTAAPEATGRGARPGQARGPLGGAIRFWAVRIGPAPALLLGPIAIHPTRQGEGLGAALIREGLARAAAAGHSRVMLIGDAPYYARFGFSRLAGVTMPPPTNPDRVLGRALAPGAWAGIAGPVTRDLAAPANGPISCPCKAPPP